MPFSLISTSTELLRAVNWLFYQESAVIELGESSSTQVKSLAEQFNQSMQKDKNFNESEECCDLIVRLIDETLKVNDVLSSKMPATWTRELEEVLFVFIRVTIQGDTNKKKINWKKSKKLAKHLLDTSNVMSSIQPRVKLAQVLYNNIPLDFETSGNVRYEIWYTMLKFVTSSEVTAECPDLFSNLLLESLSPAHVRDMIRDWKISEEDRFKFLKKAAGTLYNAQVFNWAHAIYRMIGHELKADTDSYSVPNFIISALNDDDFKFYDYLLEYECIRSDSDKNLIKAFLNCVIGGKIADLRRLISAQRAEVLADLENEISMETLLTKTRLVVTCSMMYDSSVSISSNDLPLEVLAQRLDCDLKECESFVASAIANRSLIARIDQSNNSVRIANSQPLTFNDGGDMKGYTSLSVKLGRIIMALENILSSNNNEHDPNAMVQA